MFLFNFKLFLCVNIYYCIALPVTKDGKNEEKDAKNSKKDNSEMKWEDNLEYSRYLGEVVQTLESDPNFRKRLEEVDYEHIVSGNISKDLDLVSHHIRTRLDEVKRRELDRISKAFTKENELKHGINRDKIKLNHLNTKDLKFSGSDLQNLIRQVQTDLEKLEKEKSDDFKKHEMEKRFQYENELKTMDEDHRKKAIKEHEEMIKRRRNHEKPHHPGSKPQFEEVWEEQDHMKGEDFDPNTFFHVHDLDGNGVWDEMELKTLFNKELDKMYDPNSPDTDLRERYEEMDRMTKHVFNEVDLNKDLLISYDEFMAETKKNEFQEDPGWEGIDDNPIFDSEEYKNYINEYHHGIPPSEMRIGHEGMPPAVNHIPQGYQQLPQGYQLAPISYQQVPQGYQQIPQGHQQVPQSYHQVPQGYHQVPQDYQQVPQSYQQLPQGYQQIPQGYQEVPQSYHQVPRDYQQVPQGYQQLPQGYQQIPQGYQQVRSSNSLPRQGLRYSEHAGQIEEIARQDLHIEQHISQQTNNMTSRDQDASNIPAVPKPVTQGQVKIQPIASNQAMPPHSSIPSSKGSNAKVPGDSNQGQIPPQHDSPLNQQPELKPLGNNKIV